MKVLLIHPALNKDRLLYEESAALRLARSAFNRFSAVKFGGGNIAAVRQAFEEVRTKKLKGEPSSNIRANPAKYVFAAIPSIPRRLAALEAASASLVSRANWSRLRSASSFKCLRNRVRQFLILPTTK